VAPYSIAPLPPEIRCIALAAIYQFSRLQQQQGCLLNLSCRHALQPNPVQLVKA
jgi:hypothetical protein